MLLRFKCQDCGTVLVARAGFGGGDISCRLCGTSTPLPDAPAPEKAQPKPTMQSTTNATSDDFARNVAEQASSDGQVVAWTEARAETAGERLRGMVFTTIGSIVSALGLAGYVYADVLDFPAGSCIVAAAMGGLACVVGITIWRLSAQATQYEYRKRLPVVTDRIRQQYWNTRRPGVGPAGEQPEDAWMGHAPVAPSIRPMSQ